MLVTGARDSSEAPSFCCWSETTPNAPDAAVPPLPRVRRGRFPFALGVLALADSRPESIGLKSLQAGASEKEERGHECDE